MNSQTDVSGSKNSSKRGHLPPGKCGSLKESAHWTCPASVGFALEKPHSSPSHCCASMLARERLKSEDTSDRPKPKPVGWRWSGQMKKDLEIIKSLDCVFLFPTSQIFYNKRQEK